MESTQTNADRIRAHIGLYLVDNVMDAEYCWRCMQSCRAIIRCESLNNKHFRAFFGLRVHREYEIQQAEQLEAELELAFGRLLDLKP